jgi:hypothetical protein
MASHDDPHAAQSSPAEVPYVPRDTISETGKTAVIGFGSGLLAASIQNALSRRNVGAFGIFTRGAPIIGIASKRTSMQLCN